MESAGRRKDITDITGSSSYLGLHLVIDSQNGMRTKFYKSHDKSLKILCSGLLTHDVDRKTFEAMTLGYVTSLLANILSHKNLD
jgi:hypothetical protein